MNDKMSGDDTDQRPSVTPKADKATVLSVKHRFAFSCSGKSHGASRLAHHRLRRLRP
jgi:hypothetical protein